MHRKTMLILTLLLSGRMMTLPYILKAGGTDIGDPPLAWLMPLIGDAVIGVLALAIAYLIAKKKGLWVWTSIIVWNSLAIWDALSAFIIQTTNPWDDFFMIKMVGTPMFFAASAMHLYLIFLACQAKSRKHFFNTLPTTHERKQNHD